MKCAKRVRAGGSGERRTRRGRVRETVPRREARVQESEERLAHALDAGAIGLFDWDIRADRAVCTGPYFELFGLDPRGRSPSVSDWLGWVHPEDRERIREELRAALEDGAPYDAEYRVIRQDGAVRWASSKAKLFFDPEGKPCRMIGTLIDITERKSAEEALRESQAALERSCAQLQALNARLLAALEEERRRVSRELHDDLNQRLAVLAMSVEALEQQPALPHPRLREELRALRDRVVTLSDAVRRVAYELHPSILEHLGLPVALKSCCAEFTRQERISVTFRTCGVCEGLPQEVALSLYRLAQEALDNLARHSRASRGTVTLAGSAREVRLSIADYGVGFDPGVARAGGGLGLIGMEERVRLVGGRLRVESHRGKGTRIEVYIPLAVRHPDGAGRDSAKMAE